MEWGRRKTCSSYAMVFYDSIVWHYSTRQTKKNYCSRYWSWMCRKMWFRFTFYTCFVYLNKYLFECKFSDILYLDILNNMQFDPCLKYRHNWSLRTICSTGLIYVNPKALLIVLVLLEIPSTLNIRINYFCPFSIAAWIENSPYETPTG